jgi:hypothetical protein
MRRKTFQDQIDGGPPERGTHSLRLRGAVERCGGPAPGPPGGSLTDTRIRPTSIAGGLQSTDYPPKFRTKPGWRPAANGARPSDGLPATAGLGSVRCDPMAGHGDCLLLVLARAWYTITTPDSHSGQPLRTATPDIERTRTSERLPWQAASLNRSRREPTGERKRT